MSVRVLTDAQVLELELRRRYGIPDPVSEPAPVKRRGGCGQQRPTQSESDRRSQDGPE